MRSNGQNNDIKPCSLTIEFNASLGVGRWGGGGGYSGKITTTRCVDFWGGDIV